MPTIKEIIRSAMARKGLSVHQLAQQIGCREQQVYLVLKRGSCNYETLAAFMQVLDLEIRPKDCPQCHGRGGIHIPKENPDDAEWVPRSTCNPPPA